MGSAAAMLGAAGAPGACRGVGALTESGSFAVRTEADRPHKAGVEDPDTPLVVAVASGDQEAARALVERHLPRMLALARRMLGNAAEAEDVAQDVFLRVWTHAAKWEPGRARFETWLHRVALNLCYDRLRKKREVASEEMPERADPGPDPEAQLYGAQVAARVEAALAELPERQRTAITLCHTQGLSNIEAAELLEVSVEALESLLARGRRKLRELLRAEAPELIGGL